MASPFYINVFSDTKTVDSFKIILCSYTITGPLVAAFKHMAEKQNKRLKTVSIPTLRKNFRYLVIHNRRIRWGKPNKYKQIVVGNNVPLIPGKQEATIDN